MTIYNPSKINNYLYRGEYRLNKNYEYDYKQVQSLCDWWEYLDHKHYRYTYFVCVLDYDHSDDHKPSNITSFLKSLRRSFKMGNEKIPLHSVWKLEHRKKNEPKKSKGFHYHLILCFNNDISPSTTILKKLVEKYWKWGAVFTSSSNHSPRTIDEDWEGRKLPYPIKNTQTEHYAGLFHHFSYLAKKDPNQALPSNYIGDSFRASQAKPEKLTDHKMIRSINNTIRLEPPAKMEEPIIYANIPTDDEWNSDLPF